MSAKSYCARVVTYMCLKTVQSAKVSTTRYNCAKVCIYTVGRPYRWKGLCLHCYSGGHYYRCKGVRALMKLPEGRKASITSHAPYTFLTPRDNT